MVGAECQLKMFKDNIKRREQHAYISWSGICFFGHSRYRAFLSRTNFDVDLATSHGPDYEIEHTTDYAVTSGRYWIVVFVDPRSPVVNKWSL
jgi:hypothetical protein